MNFARTVFLSGTLAALSSLAVLMIAARLEGRAMPQPMNATSHWLHGDRAAVITHLDAKHTGTGIATHLASATFWAIPFSAWLSWRRPRTFAHILCGAAATSAFAAFFDYKVISHRLTPGWELALSPASVSAALASIAPGLAAGGWIAQRK